MRNISHIVAPSMVLDRQGGRSPSRDFADELDKADDRGGRIHPRHQVAEGHVPQQVPAEQSVCEAISRITEGGGPIAASAVVWASSGSGGMNMESAQQLDGVVQPTGVTEALVSSRVFGIHLLAGTYLSELYASADQTTSFTPLNTVPSEPKGVTEKTCDVSSGMSLNTATTGADTSLWNEAVDVFGLFAMNAVEVATDESRSSAPAKIVPEASQEALWPEDSLRLTKQLDGSLTLWLRDYRMDDTQAIHVVGALVKEAGSRGMHLGRILLNGREVWTSPNEY